ncbi:MAG: hypothetical protein M3O70_07350 [Actinomycetota bacterium]|nr:hypothetical protein [Actinomycetota bacterium]
MGSRPRRAGAAGYSPLVQQVLHSAELDREAREAISLSDERYDPALRPTLEVITEVRRLEAEVEELRALVEELRAANERLRDEHKMLTMRDERLEVELERLRAANERLRARLPALEGDDEQAPPEPPLLDLP